MHIIKNRKDFQCQASHVIIGKFEGMHLGHQALLEELQQCGTGDRVMFTFHRNPGQILRQQKTVLLTGEERRHYVAGQVDDLIEYPFDEETRKMSPEQFIKKVLVEQLHSKRIIVGNDFTFGYQRQGTVELLKRYEKQFGYQTVVIPQVFYKDNPISSTRIKQTMDRGGIQEANQMLGYSFFAEGIVVYGNQIGRRVFGVPTANITPADDKYLPPNGVYFSRILLEKEEYYGITNIGNKPTIQGNNPRNIETHLFDFDRDIYGQFMKVELLAFERPETRFPSMALLAEQLHRDVAFGKQMQSKIILDKPGEV